MVIEQLKHLPFFEQLWQRLETIPPPRTEESILLRVLVQALVIIGIIATDVAAQTQMSFWAIPLSIIGATWSWSRRKKRNVETKFLLALAMIGVMLAFFGNLLANLNDTRLVLAQLLIQLQVLHSFDLPRRKDLGYSMVIGLILLGVAGTVSQTLAFGPFLLIFLAVALPVLVLDYRSRLGLDSLDAVWKKKRSPLNSPQNRPPWYSFLPLSPKGFSLLLLVVLTLGLVIFAAMPRFGGYQLQSFPVSSPIDLDSQNFNAQERGIVNPGYAKEGEASNDSQGIGKAKTQGPGEIDDTFYYGFSSKINQNLRGELKKKVVMRIRSQAPGFWQVLAFDRYTGQGWEISRDQQITNIQRPNWSYRFYISSPPTAIKTKKTIQSYTVVSELPNLIPALSYPRELFFPTKEVAVDPEGSLRSPVSLIKGLTYTVISEVPYRDRTLLKKAKTKYPRNISNYYLQIPPQIAEKVKKRAEELLSKSEQPITSAYEKALFLAQSLKQNYTIEPDLPFFQKEEDLVESFLFRHLGGYPDHFSTVLTVMLRSLGIPARLVVGFAPGEFNPFTGYYVVHNTDAYALTEVFFPGYGWFTFDPIPGHEVIPPSFEESQTFGILRQFWDWIAGWLPSPVTSLISFLWSEIIGKLLGIIVGFWQFVSKSLIGLFTGLLAAIALIFLGWLGWNSALSWNYRRRLRSLPPMERLYQQMLELLKTKGYPKHPAQTPLEYAIFLRQYLQTIPAKVIEEISQAYVSWRYGEQIPDIEYLRSLLRGLTRSMRKNKEDYNS